MIQTTAMKRSRILPVIISLLLLISLFSGTAYAKYDSAEYSDSIVQMNVVHEITVPQLDSREFLIWSSAAAFAIGQGTTAEYFITDGAAFDYTIALDELVVDFAGLYEEKALAFNYDEFLESIEVSDTTLYIVHEGANIPVDIEGQVNGSSIALLKLAAGNAALNIKPLALADTTFSAEGDEAHTFCLAGDELYGMVPIENDAYVTNWSIEGVDTQLSYVGTSSSTGFPVCKTQDAKSRAYQGMPLLNYAGSVIGINTWETSETTLVSLINDPIITLLTAYNVPFVQTEDTDASTLDMGDLIKYIAVLAGAIIVLVALLLIMRARKKSKEENDDFMYEDEDEPEAERPRRERIHQPKAEAPQIDQEVDMSHTIEYSVAPAPAAAPEAAPAPKGRPLRAVLKGMTGTLAGRNFTVSGRIVIGRDPTIAKVLFEPAQTVISKRHCCVSYSPESGRITLEDLNSANGTYLEDGTRLLPGKAYPIKSGDCFYLGLPENMFRITV